MASQLRWMFRAVAASNREQTECDREAGWWVFPERGIRAGATSIFGVTASKSGGDGSRAVHKRSQLFIRTHNETFSVAAMRLRNI